MRCSRDAGSSGSPQALIRHVRTTPDLIAPRDELCLPEHLDRLNAIELSGNDASAGRGDRMTVWLWEAAMATRLAMVCLGRGRPQRVPKRKPGEVRTDGAGIWFSNR